MAARSISAEEGSHRDQRGTDFGHGRTDRIPAHGLAQIVTLRKWLPQLICYRKFGRQQRAVRHSAQQTMESNAARSLAGKPLAGFCAMRGRRIQDLYGMVVHVIRCNTHTMPSIIDVKKTPAWGEIEVSGQTSSAAEGGAANESQPLHLRYRSRCASWARQATQRGLSDVARLEHLTKRHRERALCAHSLSYRCRSLGLV